MTDANVATARDAVHLPPPSGPLRLGDFDFELPDELIANILRNL